MAKRKKESKATARNPGSGASGGSRKSHSSARAAIQGELFTDPADAYVQTQMEMLSRKASSSTAPASQLNESGIEPAEHSKGDRLWDAFMALKDPGDANLDAILTQLIALPEEEEIRWNEVFRGCARWETTDLSAVFRKISSGVPHTRKARMGFFYWAAVNTFLDQRTRYAHLLPEVVDGFLKMDVESYDVDALFYIGLHLLDAGYVDEALKLAEHFLPILRQDDGLTPWAVADHCNHLFELRIGQALRDIAPGSPLSVEEIANTLRREIEEEIHADPAQAAAVVIAGQTSAMEWNRSLFDLVTGDITEDEQAWQDNIRLFTTLVRVAQEAWHIDKEPPGRTFPGLYALLKCAYGSKSNHPGTENGTCSNLLDDLLPDGLEERIAKQCPDVLGINEPQARILIDAYGILNRFALRHDFISAHTAENTDREVLRLRKLLARTVD